MLYNPCMDYGEYFSRETGVAGGQVVMRGTRIPLRTVLSSLAEGNSFDELLKAFPTLTEQHLKAAVAFAAASALDDQPVPAVPRVSG